jgi:hypothetical protein
MASRHSALALGILLAASGCRTAGVGNLAREEPAPPKATLTAAEVIREHNRTAERIESLEARPSITVTSSEGGGVVQGNMALERPRNFSLVLFGGPSRMKMADIGSNDEEFWFWVKDRNTKEYYFCEYDETGKSPLATTLQPELIVEALGLRVIPEAESAGCTIQPGPTPGTLALVYRPTKMQGETLSRMTILSESSRRIREHRVYSGEGDGKTLLAQAVVKGYQPVPLPSETGESDEQVYLPSSLRIDWLQEKLSLDVTMSSPKINTVFTQARRDALFVEPKPRGYTRVNLAERAGIADAQGQGQGQGSTSIRESRTAPPTGIQLLEPSTIRADRTTQAPHEPVPLAADLASTPIEPEQIIRARVPQAPQPDFVTAGEPASRSGWRGLRPVGRE